MLLAPELPRQAATISDLTRLDVDLSALDDPHGVCPPLSHVACRSVWARRAEKLCPPGGCTWRAKSPDQTARVDDRPVGHWRECRHDTVLCDEAMTPRYPGNGTRDRFMTGEPTLS